jgi:hypothetical protein
MSSPRYTFLQHPLTPPQRLWLTTLARTPDLSSKSAKVQLYGQLPPDFSADQIDPRLYFSGRPTPIGLWVVDPVNPLFHAMDQTIRAVQQRILDDPNVVKITAAEISQQTHLTEAVVGAALYAVGLLGHFFTQAVGVGAHSLAHSSIALTDETAYDEYLRYTGMEDLLERVYLQRGKGLQASLAYSNRDVPVLEASPPTAELEAQRQNTVFVIMAMSPNIPELQDVYHTIKAACADFGLNAYRVDELEHPDTITQRVLTEIATCRYLVADLSYERPNVYYEIGYAHGLKLSPILFRKTGTPLHFDLSVHKAPEYKNLTELGTLLRGRLAKLTGRTCSSTAA